MGRDGRDIIRIVGGKGRREEGDRWHGGSAKYENGLFGVS